MFEYENTANVYIDLQVREPVSSDAEINQVLWTVGKWLSTRAHRKAERKMTILTLRGEAITNCYYE